MIFIDKIIEDFHVQIIATVVVLVLVPLLKIFIKKLILKYGTRININEPKATVTLKSFSFLINILAIILLITIWGVNPKNIFIAFSSVFAIIGVAFFAQWSLLSNITAGIIIYFTAPFKIGDTIKIQDKDFPLEALVEDITSFYVHLKTAEGEVVVFPNNLILQRSIEIKG